MAKLRKYLNHQFYIFRPRGLMYADNDQVMEIFKEAAKKNIFFDVNFFDEARHKSTRDQWQRQMNELVNRIYSMNKPHVHKMELELLN